MACFADILCLTQPGPHLSQVILCLFSFSRIGGERISWTSASLFMVLSVMKQLAVSFAVALGI